MQVSKSLYYESFYFSQNIDTSSQIFHLWIYELLKSVNKFFQGHRVDIIQEQKPKQCEFCIDFFLIYRGSMLYILDNKMYPTKQCVVFMFLAAESDVIFFFSGMLEGHTWLNSLIQLRKFGKLGWAIRTAATANKRYVRKNKNFNIEDGSSQNCFDFQKKVLH